jgi:hypothetical protein
MAGAADTTFRQLWWSSGGGRGRRWVFFPNAVTDGANSIERLGRRGGFEPLRGGAVFGGVIGGVFGKTLRVRGEVIGVNSPTARPMPAAISAVAATLAWNRPGFMPMLSNQPAVPLRPPGPKNLL